MKKYIYITLIFSFVISFFININEVYAAEATTGTTTGAVNIRKGPGTNYSSVATLAKGKTVTLVSTTLVKNEKGCSAGWYQINYGGSTTRYICSTFVNLSNSSVNYFTTEKWDARTSSNGSIIRKSASTSSTAVITLSYGTELKILSEGKTGNGCSGIWYKVSYHNNQTGYICSTVIYKIDNVTKVDEEYNKVLEVAGFPESYWPFLNYLHDKYPTWTFNAIKTNINFRSAVDGEEGKNYMETKIAAYRTSSTPVEGKTWYRATTGVIAFYLDPRNFLNEKTIFMFENLGYDPNSQTPEVIKSIFGTGKFAGDEYVNALVSAATTHNVSPVHLASRIKQEVGSSGNDATSGESFTWNGKTYSGYYNFFNIGAYGDNPLLRGLAYAAGLLDNKSYGVPWDSIEKSIKGGAQFISGSYISKGQYTMYFQKFNVSPTSSYSKYTHQYMTNVNAPTAEALSTYSSYKSSKQLSTAYSFAIPVYENMPSDYITLPPIGDTNNDLSSISVNGVAINNFDKDILEYEYSIANTATKVTIAATSVSTKSTIDGLGEYTLTDDSTVINIVVTSEAGLSQKYKITINKVEAKDSSIDEILVLNDMKVYDTYLTGITPSTTGSALISKISAFDSSVTIKIKNTNNEEKTNSILATGDQVTITKGEIAKTYVVAIKGDTSGDGKITILDLLQVQKHLLKSTTLTSYKGLAADTNYDDKITILDLLRVQKHILGDLKLK